VKSIGGRVGNVHLKVFQHSLQQEMALAVLLQPKLPGTLYAMLCCDCALNGGVATGAVGSNGWQAGHPEGAGG
jgi:hypothetical protein